MKAETPVTYDLFNWRDTIFAGAMVPLISGHSFQKVEQNQFATLPLMFGLWYQLLDYTLDSKTVCSADNLTDTPRKDQLTCNWL